MGQARNEALADGLDDGREYNGNRARRLLYGAQGHGAVGRYHVRCEFQQFCSSGAGLLVIGNSPTIIDLKIAADPPAALLKFLAKCRDAGLPLWVAFGKLYQQADAPHPLGLLRARRERPRRRRRRAA